jgi:predicted nucleotidyltransferase
MLYHKIFKSLQKHQVSYLLCGGVAVNIYGVARMTADIDVLLDFERKNLERFSDATAEIGYQPLIPVSIIELSDASKRNALIKDKNLIAFSLINTMSPYMNIDVVTDVPLNFDDMWERRETRMMGGYDLQIVSVDDLILLKEYAGRVQDKKDIELLKKLINEK